MSTSPQPTQSAKRPLEETSSPSRNDQPDAKRPALDKVIKDDEEEVQVSDSNPTNGDSANQTVTTTVEANGVPGANGEKEELKVAELDTEVPDAPETKLIVGTASNMVVTVHGGVPQNSHDESAWIHIRAVISSPEAATVIGKGGENVSKIRQLSGAKCTVSDYQKGAVERILTVSGVVDAAAKVNSLHS